MRRGASFLDLPPTIRHRIYSEAGFGPRKFINLNYWNPSCYSTAPRSRIEDLEEYGPETDTYRLASRYCGQEVDLRMSEDPFPAGLLRVCSVVHDEVEAFLYSQNCFAVTANGPSNGLCVLHSISDAAIKHLRFLIIDFRTCHCKDPYCTKTAPPQRAGVLPYWNTYRHDSDHCRPVDQLDEDLIFQCQAICDHIKGVTQPWLSNEFRRGNFYEGSRLLKLYFHSYVRDLGTANILCDAFLTLPLLKDAGIGLSYSRRNGNTTGSNGMAGERRARMQLLAAKTARLRAPFARTDQAEVRCFEGFRFTDLPFELQERVLRNTELIRYRRVYVRANRSIPIPIVLEDMHTCDDAHLLHERQDSVGERSFFSTICYPGRPLCLACHSDGGAATLKRHRGVSKAFGELSRRVFYSHNEFCFPATGSTPGDATLEKEWGVVDHDHYLIGLPVFLERTGPNFVCYLTHLTVVFPPCTPDYLEETQQGWGWWMAAVDHLCDWANLPALKLEVHFRQLGHESHRPLASRPVTEPDTRHDAKMFKAYMRILRPLRWLRKAGLRAFLVYVAWPVGLSELERRQRSERRLERMVMGRGYDSLRWGKSLAQRRGGPRMVELEDEGYVFPDTDYMDFEDSNFDYDSESNSNSEYEVPGDSESG